MNPVSDKNPKKASSLKQETRRTGGSPLRFTSRNPTIAFQIKIPRKKKLSQSRNKNLQGFFHIYLHPAAVG
jgi:hypothetical protein